MESSGGMSPAANRGVVRASEGAEKPLESKKRFEEEISFLATKVSNDERLDEKANWKSSFEDEPAVPWAIRN
jgi:hypothetical protein